MNTTLIYKEHGNNIIRRDAHVRNDNEQNVIEFLNELCFKGILDRKKLIDEINDKLSEKIVNSIFKEES